MSQQPQFHHDRAYNSNEQSTMKSHLCECDHGDDIIFTFGVPLAKAKMTYEVKFTEDEKKLSVRWMDYLVNFATSG